MEGQRREEEAKGVLHSCDGTEMACLRCYRPTSHNEKYAEELYIDVLLRVTDHHIQNHGFTGSSEAEKHLVEMEVVWQATATAKAPCSLAGLNIDGMLRKKRGLMVQAQEIEGPTAYL